MLNAKAIRTIVFFVIVSSFMFGVVKLFLLRFEAGDVFPAYSSLRSDPLGSRAFYSSLENIDDTAVSRNYRSLQTVEFKENTVFFYIGTSVFDSDSVSAELLQIQKTRKLDINEETYFKIISDKTASLLETCCTIGALSATDNPEYHQAMREFGKSIGLAFQIKDDILDYEGTMQLMGKPVGGDIKEKKITLPLIYSLMKVSDKEAKRIRKIIKNGSNKRDVKEVINFVKENGGIEYAIETARSHSEKAKLALSILPDSQSKVAMEALVNFIIDRKN